MKMETCHMAEHYRERETAYTETIKMNIKIVQNKL